MILVSLKNFFATYISLFRLVFYQDKKELLVITVVYLVSFAFLALAFLIVLAILKSTILQGDFRFQQNVDFGFAGYQFSGSKVVGVVVLGCFFLLSAFSAYLAERRWFTTIEKIVSVIAKEKLRISASDQKRQIRTGAISTIRVSGMLLNILTPSLVGVFSFMFLFYMEWRLAIFTLVLIFTAASLYLTIGRKTKKLSSDLLDDDDDIDVKASTDSSTSISERLVFISNLFQLKAKSKLIVNYLFILFVFGLVIYLLTIPKDAEQVYKLVVSGSLIYLCFNGVKVFGSKAVPLSRQYNHVKEFISVTTQREKE